MSLCVSSDDLSCHFIPGKQGARTYNERELTQMHVRVWSKFGCLADCSDCLRHFVMSFLSQPDLHAYHGVRVEVRKLGPWLARVENSPCPLCVSIRTCCSVRSIYAEFTECTAG
jgi:hypothetical protein